MKRYTAHIEALTETGSVLEFVWRVARRIGATGFSYHQTPIFDSPTSRDTIVFARGFPVDFQHAYISEGYREIDPIPALTFAIGPILTWSKAMELGRAALCSNEYFQQMQRRNLVDGVSMALFGPRSRNAYVSVAFSRPPDEFAPGELSLLHGLFQTAHLHICTILDRKDAPISLSERELEVLRWLVKGKSGTDIATILNISPETVRTYTRRIYDKLHVTDRVAATVRALKLGIVDA